MIDEIAEIEPFAPFRRWRDEAWQGEPNAHAMMLATTTPEGRPSARAVLLNGLDDRGFVFYTNLESRKSKELLTNPHAALCFLWKSLNRQVRVEGPVELVTDEEADAYFASRPRDSQIGAWASDQSQPLPSRAELERRWGAVIARAGGWLRLGDVRGGRPPALGSWDFFTGSAWLGPAAAAGRRISPVPVASPPAGIVVMVFSIIVTIGLVSYQRHVVRRTGSIAISADELHYRSDVVLNVSVIAALVLGSIFDFPLLDPIFGAAIGIWIVYSALRLARLSLFQLMDHELPDDEREQIRRIAQSHPDVVPAHDLRTRVAGPTPFIQLHLEMDRGLSLIRAHEISDEVEAELRAPYPHAEAIIHHHP